MTLAEYLKSAGLTDEQFGKLCRPPIHRTTVWLYKKRKISPRAEKVAAIEKATGFQVRAHDLSSSK